jgi:very-short-patch-repair endonuclease
MRLDFYLPEYNVAIECQGIQHFEPIDFFGGENALKERKELDSLKKKLCDKHGIKIFYYSNCGIEYPYEVYEDLDKLLKEIKEHSYFETMKEVLCESK